jgi:hypothetical protein
MDATGLSDRLLTGERILWSGTPAQGLLLTGRDWLLIPFSLIWCGFAVFWETTVAATQAPIFFQLWGIPFVLIGLYFVAGRFLVDAWLRSQTFYAVTNERVLIARIGPFGKFTAMSLDRMPDASLSERPDGRGTIRFGQQRPFWGNRGGFSVWSPSLDPTPQFIAIENARGVFDRLQLAAQKGA